MADFTTVGQTAAPRVDVTAEGGAPPLAIYTFRFAWRAVHPDDTTWLD